MSSPVLREFRYRLSRVQLVVMFPLVVCGAALFLYFAIYPPQKPVMVHGIQLSPAEFRIVMGVFAAMAPVGLGFMAVALVSSFTHHSRIALTANSIILPKPDWWGNSWGEDEMELQFDEITSVDVVPFVGRAIRLEITHSEGKVGIPSNMLSNRREFDLLAQLLATAIASRY